jgi:site-specific recombinase XerD
MPTRAKSHFCAQSQTWQPLTLPLLSKMVPTIHYRELVHQPSSIKFLERHSCTSRVAAGGATDATLQTLLGWMSPKMIERYSHLRAEAKRKAVAVFDVKVPKIGSPHKSPQADIDGNENVM